MFQIDLKNRMPIYEQVISKFVRLILSGGLEEGSRVPSVRELAREIGVNPNTVQKAYRELEGRGYIYTVLGQGSFISSLSETKSSKETEDLYEKLKQIVLELLLRGESEDNVIFFIEKIHEPQRSEEV